jgi:alpha-D-xyloside xylohydrolase
MIGDRLLAAPVTAGERQRTVYLPAGDWFDFWTGQRVEGGKSFVINVLLDDIPLFIKGGAVFPLAQPGLHTEDPSNFNLGVRIYGDGSLPCMLFEDDGVSFDVEKGVVNRLTLSWDQETQEGKIVREGEFSVPQYTVLAWMRF